MLEDKVGYVQARSLEPGKVKAIAQAVKDLEKQGMQKLTLDLRHAAVGSPEDGIELARLFLEKGTVATLSGQKVTTEKFEADPAKVIWKGPMVVLTNRGANGGAEVAAAALLDNKRAPVVGERTYGDAALRKTVTTEDGGAVLLAVAKYQSPSGKSIMDNSVTPSLAVIDPEASGPDDDEDRPAAAPPSSKSQEDLVLKKALEVLQKGLPAESAKAAPKAEPVAVPGPLGVPRKR
jgi:carboxyl-terminal processing protease